jgi:hypothetical protein
VNLAKRKKETGVDDLGLFIQRPNLLNPLLNSWQVTFIDAVKQMSYDMKQRI